MRQDAIQKNKYSQQTPRGSPTENLFISSMTCMEESIQPESSYIDSVLLPGDQTHNNDPQESPFSPTLPEPRRSTRSIEDRSPDWYGPVHF